MKKDDKPNTGHDTGRKRVIRLDDLDWQDEAVGGAGGKLFFGENADAVNPFEDARKNDSRERTTQGNKKPS